MQSLLLSPMTTDQQSVHSFFFSVYPGFVDLARHELEFWVTQADPQVGARHLSTLLTFPDGIEVQLPLQLGYELNHWLKIPSRILLRWQSFRVRDFPKLYNKLRKLPWGPFCTSPTIQFVISTHSSRLKLKRKIEETCASAYQAYRKAQPAGHPHTLLPQRIFVRLVDDQCGISIDTSGENLHRRGYRTRVTPAPLRETLAAGLLWHLRESEPPLSTTEIALADPMVGSGTFLAEALLMNKATPRRTFSYLHFSGPFQAALSPNGYRKTLEHVAASQQPWKLLLGQDQNREALDVTAQNLHNLNLPGIWQLKHQELLATDATDATNKILTDGTIRTWLICNPPYGERLAGRTPPQQMIKLYQRFLSQAVKIWRPERMGWVLPRGAAPALNLAGYLMRAPRKFLNGGIPVEFVVWQKKPDDSK